MGGTSGSQFQMHKVEMSTGRPHEDAQVCVSCERRFKLDTELL